MNVYKRKQLLRAATVTLFLSRPAIHTENNLPYTTYASFEEVLRGSARYPALVRVSDPEPAETKLTQGSSFTNAFSLMPRDVTYLG